MMITHATARRLVFRCGGGGTNSGSWTSCSVRSCAICIYSTPAREPNPLIYSISAHGRCRLKGRKLSEENRGRCWRSSLLIGSEPRPFTIWLDEYAEGKVVTN